MAQRQKAVSIEQIEFAGNIKFVRKKLGYSQTKVANAAHLSTDFISAFERHIMGIGIDSMGGISRSLKIPLYLLLQPGFQKSFDFDSRLSNWEQYLKLLPVCENGTSERLIFGRNFKSAREKIKYTQVNVMERSGIPDSLITLIERGTSGAEFDTALRLSHCVGISLFILFKP